MSMSGAALVNALGWALLHFLWQGALAAAVYAALEAATRTEPARARHGLAAATLAAMALLPPLTLVATWPQAGAGPGTRPATALMAGSDSAALTVVPEVPEPAMGMRARVGRRLPGLVALWSAGVVVLSLRLLGGWAVVRRMRGSARALEDAALVETMAALARRMRLRRPVRLLASARVDVPTVVGWMRPAVLWPVATLAGLGPEQAEALLAHELAHVRRHDSLVSLLQGAVETLLFYHPAVWWVSHRLRVEREMCCDDEAIAACGNPVRYARALADLELLRPSPRLAPAASGGTLADRVVRILNARDGHGSHGASRAAGLFVLVATLLCATAVGALRAAVVADPRAAAREDSATSTPPAPEASPAAQSPSGAPRPVPIERVLELARAGVTPEYIDGMEAAGHPDLSWEDLIAMRQRGVDPEFIHGLADLGYPGLTTSQLVSLRSQGVSPEYVREMGEQRLKGLSISELVELRNQGVSAEYVRDLQAQGYRGLSVPELIGLRSQGVTPEFVREIKDAGYDHLTVAELIDLRGHGVEARLLRKLAGRRETNR
jgi:beta-lactamase regulating signal transducer with metallopeptidase domain